jgi:hypothetical protein
MVTAGTWRSGLGGDAAGGDAGLSARGAAGGAGRSNFGAGLSDWVGAAAG